MAYLEVVVNSPGGRHNTFVYSHEPGSGATVGSLLLVPFGAAQAQAIVVGLPDEPPDLPIRPILSLLDSEPVVSANQIALAHWIAGHYCSPLLEALLPMLPPGIARRPRTVLSLVPDAPLPAEIGELEYLVYDLLRQKRKVEVAQIRQALALKGKARQSDQVIKHLSDQGLIRRETTLRSSSIHPRTELWVRATVPIDQVDATLAGLARSIKRRDLLSRLLDAGEEPVSVTTLRDEGVGNLPMVRNLAERGLATLEQREVRRDPLAFRTYPVTSPPVLTSDQQTVWSEVSRTLAEPGYHPFLLHGITGSGKTEIYLRLIAAALSHGRRAIVLVPEISLTPQAIHRFSSRFAGRVAVLHSQLTAGERFDEWRRIRSGQADVVVGSQSAVFAPVSNLGVIVVDEEHESSYKSERSPRYHARDVALKLGEIAGLTVLLGRATPALESYLAAKRGTIRLLALPERVEAARDPRITGAGLPPVQLVDLRSELRAGNRSIFSGPLRDAIELALRLREQTILFLNRRGDSTFVLCRDCGHVLRCDRCDVPFVYHSDGELLVCHLCDSRRPIPRGCPSCWGERIRYFGLGTQKLEAETRRAFPQARVLRWDRDAARARGAHEELLRSFTNHEADILVGTQMIAKGLDLPRVTLVGVIAADLALHLPDFRAAERTFQLLTQVAGRAGRGPLGGKVIIQAYTPEHYSIQAARTHDYQTFFEREIEFRREHAYPPLTSIARLLRVGPGESRVQRESEDVAARIRHFLRREAIGDIEVIGPAPAFYRKIRGRYRWQIILKGRGLSEFVATLDLPPGWHIDVDPTSTL
jgi:primosomal protein N' (replication factor Y)